MYYSRHHQGRDDYYDYDSHSRFSSHRELYIDRYGGARSRFHGRYDGDRRSRSPRDRSPYGDRGDRGPQYSDGDRRRPPIDNRGNSTGFPPGRDGFRDSLSGIQPPRGPKALLDAPSGPRGGGFAGGEYRGGRGGRGGGARGGRPWRDDSRDGGRERDDYRDRSWDDRSRERDRDQRDLIRDHPRDRDWQRDLPRDRPDFGPRGRRSPPPPLRPRSPGRDFGRDPRDAPLGIDAERGRRGSRDGPLSAGSSNSDPPFGGPPFRGGGFRGGRGAMGRGRGDWDQQHQRGIGRGRGFYDDRGPDRDRFHQNQRSRSQEGGPRWGGRDQDDHNRREPPRYPEPNRDVRDERDIPRDNRDRELLRPAKLDRPSEPPSAKDVSPPPVAPSAPPFGSVLSRDIQSLTGRPPPTGPRALADERPGSAGQAVSNDRAPPTGPSKPLLTDSSPSIPSGPRAQRDQKRPTPSSIQWVNPAVKHSKDGPKSARSYSFQSQGQRPLGPFRSDFSHPEFYEHGKRARSPDAKSDSHTHSSNQYGAVYHGTGPNEIAIEGKRGSHSARASLDRDTRAPPDRQTRAATEDGDVVMGVPKETQPLADHAQSQRLEDAGMSKASATIEAPASADTQPNPPDASLQPSLPSSESEHPARLKDIEGDDQMLDHEPEKEKHIDDSSSDEEDYDAYFKERIATLGDEVKGIEDAVSDTPREVVARYAKSVHGALASVLVDGVTVTDLVNGVIRESAQTEEKPSAPEPVEPPREPTREPTQEPKTREPTRELSALPTVENGEDVEAQSHSAELQPKVEDMDVEGSALPSVPPVEEAMQVDEDVDMQDADMQDASEVHETVEPPHRSVSVSGRRSASEVMRGIFAPNPFLQSRDSRSIPSQMDDEESEDRTEDDQSIQSIYGSVEVVRQYSPTPPTEDLPPLNVRPWHENGRAFELRENSPGFGDFLLSHMDEEWTTTKAKQDELRREYRQGYDAYLRFTASDDPVAIKSRTHFASDGTTEKSGRSSHSDSRPEGNRRTTGRFATELDLKNALEQSRREHQERQEREARAQREKYRTEKEAVIPNMFWTETEKEQASFYDTAGLLPLEKLVATWNVVPWHVNFTDEEAERFERVYLEHPKQWGRIAQEMPNRDTGTIIQYYYSKKRELNLKEKLRRQPKKRKRGGRKQRSSALVSELGNGENETEDTAQETGENGERRRPPRRAAAPNFGGNEATPNADSDGATPAATPGRRRAATTAEAKNDSGAEKPEVKKVGRRKTKGEKDAVKAGKPPAQTPIPSPLAVPGKTGRSRANSKVQGPPEWVSPQTPVDLAARMPVQFEITPGSMQPPLVPHHQPQPHHTSPDRPVAPLQSTMADVMAPPPSSLTLRPDPPQPPASGPTFEIPQPAGADRNRTPQQQASSYWSVAESNDFPHLLRAFGTDWVSIAAHMQTKTPTMVKNFYMRNTKDGGKTEWEGVATEADQKARRGEKRPDPPPLSVGPRKKYDVPSGHRPLAAAEPEEATLTKIEPGPPPSSFSRFQVPIAQAAPVSHPLAQPTQTVMPTPLAPSSAPAQHQPPPGGPSVTQAMSPHNNPLRPPALPGYQYQEREPEPTPSQPPMPSSQQQQQQPQPQQQHVRISQKPPATTSAPHTPVVEVAPRPPGFDHIPHPFALVPQQKDSRELRDARERQRMEHSQREPPRPVRMKQEPSDQPAHHPEAYPPYQPPPRSEPLPLARQPEPIRVAPSSQPYAPPPVPAHQAMRSLLSDSVPQGTTPIMSANDRPPSTMQRPPPVSMQEPYGGMSLSAPSAPPPPPQPPTPARPPEPRKTSSIMSLLNDDPPPPPAPTRVAEVAASVKTSSTPPPPPPQSMGVRQPAQSTTSQSSHRDIEAGYPYSRGAPQAPPAAIPPLKPYHTQSPQSGHVRVPSSSMVSNRDAAMEAQAARDYYPRHAYPSSHQTSAASSPQTHPVHHYPQQPPQQQHAPQPHPSQRAQQHPPQHPPQHPSQHPSQHPQSQHGQQRSISYQQQQQQYPYPVSQSHAASPTPQYATHPSMQPRREPIAQPSSRDSWPPAQQQGAPQQQIHHPQQQQVQQQQQQQQLHQQHHSQQQQQQQQHAQQQQQQSSWPPSHQAPPPKTQPQVQSAWGAQHGVQAKTPVSSSVSSQQHAWPASGPSQPSQPFNLRDRAPPVYPQDTQSPTAGMVHHQHHRSLGGGQFPPASQDSRRGEPAPPPQSQPYPPRYASTPGPGQVRDPGVRSYTPANAYDSRPPPPPSYAQQQQDAIRDAQLRDMHMRDAQMREMREMQAREMRGDPRDPREMGRDPRELARGPDPRDLREMGREPGPPRDPREAAAAAAAAAAHQQAQQQAMLGRQLRPQDPYDRGVPDQRRY
ncbi:hypothetical protein QBC43DRAFT_221941 [Cladorrhinum sp. PSN259]|nr:hypothetical protein QBC43DRAFT_221941 [Cladorrhinum sp. PSN259]